MVVNIFWDYLFSLVFVNAAIALTLVFLGSNQVELFTFLLLICSCVLFLSFELQQYLKVFILGYPSML